MRIVRVLSDYATAAAAAGAVQAGRLEPLTSTWSGRAVAALIIPALVLLVVCLI